MCQLSFGGNVVGLSVPLGTFTVFRLGSKAISRLIVCLAIVLSVDGIGCRVTAATIVAPNEFTTTDAPAGTVGPLRGGNGEITFQWIFPASDFSSIPLGSPFTGIGFRLDAGRSTTPNAPTNFSRWNLQLSSSQNPLLTLSDTFADNIGPDVVTVRSGPLTIPANTFVGGSNPNSFSDIPFSTPYVYAGGELVVTLRHTAHSGNQSLITLDADRVSNGRGNSAAFPAFNAKSGTTDFFNFPVTRFTVVPEPCSLLLIAVGLLGILTRGVFVGDDVRAKGNPAKNGIS